MLIDATWRKTHQHNRANSNQSVVGNVVVLGDGGWILGLLRWPSLLISSCNWLHEVKNSLVCVTVREMLIEGVEVHTSTGGFSKEMWRYDQ